MSYGEATIDELKSLYVEDLKESEKQLGLTIQYIGPSTHLVTRDRMGSVKEFTKVAEPFDIEGASVNFSPSQEELSRAGIQEKVDCLIMVRNAALPDSLDEVNGRFIIRTNYRKSQEYRIRTIQGMGQVGSDYLHVAIGLVSK